MIFKEENLGERYRQHIFSNAYSGPTKNARFNIVVLKGEEVGVAVVWLAKVLALLELRTGREVEEKKASFVHYMELTVPWDAVMKDLGCICVRWSTSDEMYHIVCREELRNSVVKVREWCGPERLSPVVRSVHLVRSNPAIQPFTTELPWSRHLFYVNRFYTNGPAQTDTKTGYCGK